MSFKYNQFWLIYFACLFLMYTNASAEEGSQYSSCLDKPEMQASRSNELITMVEADQNERANFDNLSDEERLTLFDNDLIRRKRVGEILGEGCFKTPDDYAAASLIYQHGDVPDHYYQAFVWANRAVQLGDLNQKSLVAMTIDRYLVSIGKMQLFGSQAYASAATGWCYCLESVESSFPDSIRKEYSGFSLQDRYDRLASFNQDNGCSNIDCSTLELLQPSPKGTVPGFW